MGWFDHRHSWIPRQYIAVRLKGEETIPCSQLVYETCSCGEVRTITIAADKAPIVRYGEVYNDHKRTNEDSEGSGSQSLPETEVQWQKRVADNRGVAAVRSKAKTEASQ